MAPGGSQPRRRCRRAVPEPDGRRMTTTTTTSTLHADGRQEVTTLSLAGVWFQLSSLPAA